MNVIPSNIIRQVLFLLLIIVFGYILFIEMQFLMSAFLGAITMYIVMRQPMQYLVKKWKWYRPIAALLLMLVSIILLVLPFAWATSVGVNQLMPYIKDTSKVNDALKMIDNYLQTKANISLMEHIDLNLVYEKGISFIQSTLQNTMTGVATVFFLYLILYFMLVQHKELELWVWRNLPFNNENDQKVVKEVKDMVFSNALGIPLVAIIQGIVAWIGYMIFGAENTLLLALLTAICSVIPIIGTMLIYLPLGIYTLATGETWNGVLLLVWGFGVIGSIDNIARIFLQKLFANIHPLITLFGVFVGVNLFGVMGIIFGPLVLSLFLLFVKIYIDEYGRINA